MVRGAEALQDAALLAGWRVCGHQAGWVSSRSSWAPFTQSVSFLTSHLACAQPLRTRQGMQLTPLPGTRRSEPGKLLVSAYSSAFIKWNELFLNRRVANSLRGN